MAYYVVLLPEGIHIFFYFFFFYFLNCNESLFVAILQHFTGWMDKKIHERRTQYSIRYIIFFNLQCLQKTYSISVCVSFTQPMWGWYLHAFFFGLHKDWKKLSWFVSAENKSKFFNATKIWRCKKKKGTTWSKLCSLYWTKCVTRTDDFVPRVRHWHFDFLNDGRIQGHLNKPFVQEHGNLNTTSLKS